MLEQIRSLIAAALEERLTADQSIQSILATVETEGRADLNADENASFDEKRAELDVIDVRIDELRQREEKLSDLDERRSEAAVALEQFTRNAPAVVVRSEERTYRADGEHDFLQDAFRAKFHHDSRAAERVERARSEALSEYRSTTGNFGGLVVPQFLTSQFAENLRSGRPFLNNVTAVPLPEAGMTMTIPRGTTGTTVAAQTTQNTAVSNTTYVAADLNVPVRTFAGQQVVSRQAVERGTGIGQIIMSDLYSDYATKVNISAISGDGSAGGHFGVLNTTSVQTAAWAGTTGASLVSSIHNALGKINAGRFMAADLVVMHPRRWAWLCSQSDSSGRPLVEITGYSGDNVIGAGAASGYGIMGSVAGVPVVTDAGVPIGLGVSTDEDRIIVTRRADNLFMEDAAAPVGFNFEEVLGDSLGIRMVVFGYSAFTAGRFPVGTCVISGTGFKQVLS